MEHIGHHLKDIFFNKKNGRLVFQQKKAQKFLFFHEGLLVYAKTTHPHELIGEILFKLGKISNETYSKIDQYIEPMQSLGKSLVENDLLTEKDLHDGLMYQMREITLNIFPFFDGEFKFQEKKKSTADKFELKMNVPDLIEEGIRRMNFNPYMEEFMRDKIPFSKGKDFLDRLTKKETEILDKIDGSASAEALLLSTGTRPEFFWKSLYLFYCLNLIDVKDAKGRKKISVKKEKAKKAVVEKEKKKVKKVAEDEKKKEKKAAVDERKKRLAEVVQVKENLPDMDYYQILDVSQAASQNEIKTAYFQLARKYHPDRFDRNLPSDMKEKIEDVFNHITKAFQTLSNEKKRLEYDTMKDTPMELDKKELDKRAEMKFRQGKALYHQDKYDKALIFLEEAVRLRRNKGNYFILLAEVESKIPSFHQKAEEDFKNAIELAPWSPEGYVGLGTYYKQDGLLVKAKRHFRKALDIEPENKIALKELGMTGKPKKKGLKGILSFEVFGKKKKKKKKS